ncbi:RidA family protein [Rhodococcus sp. ACS1]|uniref:Enamine deaminase RidA, house cleaning of reactive enamine intermediates, YjgF/YER057c/UK114 family n=1 Tax=Rhodococcus koreensis TaxID=99653 RepID=A0A1H4SM74_9NOCA|nr:MULTISPECIES: RidA family protein [Rhodococcus]PBC46516.1 RidA family protein [Rhodococcus sp. ACS1]QSE82484.1 RidA family protein [Rhodococcus koreensis]SEC45177.1 Enamine deaminase RidA, house cleaning of reactive enamine intermediates, YjgF/YER057c/UK114 family [Rhodococcus koreensis]
MTTVGEDVKYVTVPGLQADAAWHWAAEAGNLVFTSGAVPHDESGDIGEDLSAGAQADRAFANLERALQAAGSSMDRIVKITGYLTDPESLPEIRTVRDKWIPNRPPSTFVYVAGLVDPRMLIEFEAIAVKS